MRIKKLLLLPFHINQTLRSTDVVARAKQSDGQQVLNSQIPNAWEWGIWKRSEQFPEYENFKDARWLENFCLGLVITPEPDSAWAKLF